jgi:diadenosine tetraphosphate (Ap4A) HIT family hydrolase
MTESLKLDAFDITARARDAYGPDGRLALPKVAHWPICPFETDTLQVRHLNDPVVPEPPRHGEAARECELCQTPDDGFLWTDEHWRVGMSEEPMALPNVWLHSREHLDFDDLTDELAAEMGVRIAWIQRALNGIEGVARVHLNRWGDGGAHFHVLLVARPEGMIQLRGIFLMTWIYAIPPLPGDVWRAMREHVTAALRSS